MNDLVFNIHTGFPRDVRGLRQYIIENLEIHTEAWPPACPPLETARLERHVFLSFYICTEKCKELDPCLLSVDLTVL